MTVSKNLIVLMTLIALTTSTLHKLEAITYVTDTGGYAYDEARAITNLAPAIALATVAIAGIIAIAVNNAHGSTSSHTHYCYKHDRSSSCSSSSSSSRSYSSHFSYCPKPTACSCH